MFGANMPFMPMPESGDSREGMIREMMCGVLGDDWNTHPPEHIEQVRQCMENAMGHVGGIVQQEWPAAPAKAAVGERRTGRRMAFLGEYAAPDCVPWLQRRMGNGYEVWTCEAEVDLAHRLAAPRDSEHAPAVAVYYYQNSWPDGRLIPFLRHFIADGGLLVYCSDHKEGFLSAVCPSITGWNSSSYYRTTHARTPVGDKLFPDAPPSICVKAVLLEDVPEAEAAYATTESSQHQSMVMQMCAPGTKPTAGIVAVAHHKAPSGGGLLFLGDMNWEESTRGLIRDAALDFIEPGARNKLAGNAHFAAKRYKEAIEAYTCALTHAPADAKLYTNRSIAVLKSGDAAGALRDAERAIEADKAWKKGYLRKGQALMALEDFRGALEAFEESPGVAGVKDAVAECRAKLGGGEGA